MSDADTSHHGATELITALNGLGLANQAPSTKGTPQDTNDTHTPSGGGASRSGTKKWRSISEGGFRVGSGTVTSFGPAWDATGAETFRREGVTHRYDDNGIMDRKHGEKYQSPVLTAPLVSNESLLPNDLLLAMGEVNVRDAYDETIESGYFGLRITKKSCWEIVVFPLVVGVGIVLFWVHTGQWASGSSKLFEQVGGGNGARFGVA